MKIRRFEFSLYLVATIIAAISILVFQILRWNYVGVVYDPSIHSWDWQIKSSQFISILVSFIVASLIFIYKGRKRLIDRDNILMIFFILVFIGEVVSSITDLPSISYLCTFLAYTSLLFLWKQTKLEIIVRSVTFVGAPFLCLLIHGNFDFTTITLYEMGLALAIDFFFCGIALQRERTRYYLYLFLGIAMAAFNGIFIVFRFAFTSAGLQEIANVFALLVWPSQITMWVMLNNLYRKY